MIDFGKDLDNRLKTLSDKKQRSKRILLKEALKLYLDIEEDKAKNKDKDSLLKAIFFDCTKYHWQRAQYGRLNLMSCQWLSC